MNPLRISARRLLAAVAIIGLVPALAAPSAALGVPIDEAASTAGEQPPYFERELLAKATPDECFAGVGIAYPAGPPCASGQAKTNQGYLWGMTRVGKKLWFGTGANVNCLTSGRNLDSTKPNLNDDWVCEYGESQIAKRNPQLPKKLGDHRPPRVYTYDTKTKQQVEKTDLIKAASTDDANRLSSTAGIRAAGNHRGVAFLGGPALGESINLFAFDTDTGGYLGSVNLPMFGNIRHFVVADGELYTGVGVGANGGNRGHVLRWTGSKSNPFSFSIVANLPAQAADLTVHAGRIFVTTWVGTDGEGLAGTGPAGAPATTAEPVTGLAAVWMSPFLAAGDRGLNPVDVNSWKQVWSVASYEPDPVVASTYALGGLASYAGYLYWGTMHVPLKATYKHLLLYPPTTEEGAQATIKNTQRAISIFRGRDFGNETPKIELLYGAPELGKFDPAANDGAGGWKAASTGYTPKFGTSGMGNPYNNYTWKMVVAGGRLYVGTMDWSYISKDLGAQAAAALNLPGVSMSALSEAPKVLADPTPPPTPVHGGDLFAFSAPNKAATVVDNSGLGNYLNYGVRNIVNDGDTLYLGMANPMNLRANPDDDVPEGGWELIELDTRRW